MEFIINISPELTMAEITKLLFNRNFLSDVQFHVAGRTIYAHSLELMKRSSVFQNLLVPTLGENKLICISDASYDNVYQFARFIYTDECCIDNSNAVGLLKLARRYKVIKLENIIIRVINIKNVCLSLYEYCLLENDQHYLRRAQMILMDNLDTCMKSSEFLIIHPLVVEEILKFNYANESEFEIFRALAQWIHQHAIDNQIKIHEHRNQYEKFIRLIRFPVMSDEELVTCTTEYRQLFSDNDLASFEKEKGKPSESEKNLWNSQKRCKLPHQYMWDFENIETIFTVSREMLFVSLRFGGDINKADAELLISHRNLETNRIDTYTINCAGRLDYSSHQINLGESIRLQPGIKYKIKVKFALDNDVRLEIGCRKKDVDVFTNITRNLIQFKQVSRNILDMYFQLLD